MTVSSDFLFKALQREIKLLRPGAYEQWRDRKVQKLKNHAGLEDVLAHAEGFKVFEKTPTEVQDGARLRTTLRRAMGRSQYEAGLVAAKASLAELTEHSNYGKF